MKVYHSHKLTALVLAVIIIVASIAQYVSAEEIVYNTETGFPLLNDVRGQLDADEIVTADDVEINMGEIYNPAETSAFRVEGTGGPASKVNIAIHSAHATDGTVFTSNTPGTYFAYFVVRPLSGHPAYEVSRRITVNVVEQHAVSATDEAIETVREDAPADEDSEDDRHEEPKADDSQTAAVDDEADPEPEPDAAEELPETYDDTLETDTGDDPAEWPEAPDENPSGEAVPEAFNDRTLVEFYIGLLETAPRETQINLYLHDRAAIAALDDRVNGRGQLRTSVREKLEEKKNLLRAQRDGVVNQKQRAAI